MVRHAQAAFLSDDYDRLTDLGRDQAAQLGAHWKALGGGFDAAFAGPRLRQRQTAEIALEAMGHSGELVILDELDEYPADRVLERRLGEIVARDDARDLVRDSGASDLRVRGRAVDRLLQLALRDWTEREIPGELESFAEFTARIGRALERLVAGSGSGQRVLAVTSAGSIGALVGRVLGTSSTVSLELGWIVNNASESEILFSPGRQSLARFNGLAHLPDRSHWTRR